MEFEDWHLNRRLNIAIALCALGVVLALALLVFLPQLTRLVVYGTTADIAPAQSKTVASATPPGTGTVSRVVTLCGYEVEKGRYYLIDENGVRHHVRAIVRFGKLTDVTAAAAVKELRDAMRHRFVVHVTGWSHPMFLEPSIVAIDLPALTGSRRTCGER